MSTEAPISSTSAPAKVTQTTVPPRRSGAAFALPKPEIPAEETLIRIGMLLQETSGDEARFQYEAVNLVRQLTGARATVLHGIDAANHPEVLGTATAAGVPPAFVSEMPVQQSVSDAMNTGTSQRKAVALAIGKVALLSVPFRLGGTGAIRVLSLVVGEEHRLWMEPSFTALHLLTQMFDQRGRVEEMNRMREGFTRSTLLIDLFSRASLARDFTETIQLICSELREYTSCGRVAIGLLNSSGQLKLEGVSGTGDLEARSHGNSLLRGAMRESLGVERPILWPPQDALDEDGVWPSGDQKELAQSYEVDQIFTMPLQTEKGEILGAWTFLWRKDRRLNEHDRELIEASEPHLAALIELTRASKPRGIRGAWQKFATGASRMKKVATIVLPLLFLALMFLPIDYKVGAEAVLQPMTARQIAAPFDGTLEESLVKPGDPVKAGQLLAKLDGKEIRWKLSEAIAKRESALKKRDQALEQQDVSAQQMARLEAEGAGLDVELLEYQQANLDILSPIDGFVISGNLERSAGVPVTTGQKLFDVAPTDRMRAEIAIPDSEVNHVETGMTTTLRLESRAGEVFDAVLEEVHPISEVFEGENVFIGTATLLNGDGTLRPGMRGKAKVETAKRSLGWIIFHKPWDWLRMRLW